jgi:PKD repeat protein
MTEKLGLTVMLCSFGLVLSAQQHIRFGHGTYNERAHEQCAHEALHAGKMQSDPAYHQEQQMLELTIAQQLEQWKSGAISKNDAIYTIPVVVHIIHTGQPYGVDANITDEQVWSAISALNDDFRKVPGTWGDGNGVDTKIEFCLAQRDPSGNAHSGINRINGCSVPLYCEQGITAGNGQGANELQVKNLSRWPNQQYYNIWVVTEIENNDGGSGIQGYAYFPTTSHVDGTVILYNAFGTVGTLKSYTNRNRTLTHELGHAFALFHTFQGASCSESDCTLQGDRVCDTPPTTLNTNCNAPACTGMQQVQNYLDYTSQTCRNMFTQGQKDRMRIAIQSSRAGLLTSQGCVPVGAPPQANFTATSTQACAGAAVTFQNTTVGETTAWLWTFQGGNPATSTEQHPIPVQYTEAGSFTVTLRATNAFGFTEEVKSNYIQVAAPVMWYQDTDGDGYGNTEVSTLACNQPPGYVSNASDCNDTNSSDWNSCYDCAGVMYGTAYLDACGVCDDDPANDCDPCASFGVSLLQAIEPQCHGQSNGTILLLVSPENASVSWNNGMEGAAIYGLPQGTYVAHASSGGCTASIEVTLGEPDVLAISFSDVTHVPCEGSALGSASYALSGGTPPYQISFMGSVLNQQSLANLAPGTYTLTATDAHMCTTSATLQILLIPCNSLDLTQVTASYCNQTLLPDQDITCAAASEALGYQWKFETAWGDVIYTATGDTVLTPYLVEGLVAGIPYTLQVRGIHPEIESVFGSPCQVAFRPGSSMLIPQHCGNTQFQLGDLLQCTSLVYANAYELRLEDQETGERHFMESPVGVFPSKTMESLRTGVPYLASVTAKWGGSWGPAGQLCTVQFAAAMAPVELMPLWCNNFEINSKKDTIALQPVQGATVYKLQLSGSNLTEPLVLQSAEARFAVSLIEGLREGTIYTARAKALTVNGWTPWGPACEIGLLEQVPYRLNLLIYPNPASKSLKTVHLLMQGDWQGLEITVRNMTGVMELSQQIDVKHQSPHPLQLPELKPGVYAVTARYRGETLTKKLVVQ